MIDPTNATGAADAMTPTGPNEYELRKVSREFDPIQGEWREVMPADAPERMAPDVLPEDTANVIEAHNTYALGSSGNLTDDTAGTVPDDELPDPEPKVITGAFVNEAVMNVRAKYDAKKKRGEAFKGVRARLDKQADAAVLAFRAEHLPELSEDQALKISRGEARIIGDSMSGFGYEES